jgi:hypothetical protein
MRPTATITLVMAGYRVEDDALRDFATGWAARHDGEPHHTAIAVLTRDVGGCLRVERSNSTAKHLAWGGALLGGALLLFAPAAGAGLLTAVGLHGAGVIVEHFDQHLGREDVSGGRQLLRQAGCAVVVVVVDDHVGDAAPVLQLAHRTYRVSMPWGDLDEELCWNRMDRPSFTARVPA